jgi:hypothetical protein
MSSSGEVFGRGLLGSCANSFKWLFQARQTPSARCMAEHNVYDGHHPTEKSSGFLALPAAQKSASSTGGGPSGEFGARNSPRAGVNHPWGVRTEYNRRLARRRPAAGVRGEWYWVWCTGALVQIYRRRQGTGPRCSGPSRGGPGLNFASRGASPRSHGGHQNEADIRERPPPTGTF